MKIRVYFCAGHIKCRQTDEQTEAHTQIHIKTSLHAQSTKMQTPPDTLETEQMSADRQGSGVTIIGRYARVANVCFLQRSPTTSYQGMDWRW